MWAVSTNASFHYIIETLVVIIRLSIYYSILINIHKYHKADSFPVLVYRTRIANDFPAQVEAETGRRTIWTE